MSQVFTVNNIAFEVAKDIYKQHFIMGNIEENDRFVDVHNYIIEASDTEDMLKAGIQAIIDHLDASGEKYCPITGMKYGYIKGWLKGNTSNKRVNPDVIIEFLDKYIIEPKKILASMITKCQDFQQLLSKYTLSPSSITLGCLVDIMGQHVEILATYYREIRPKPSNIGDEGIAAKNRRMVGNTLGAMYHHRGRIICQDKSIDKFLNYVYTQEDMQSILTPYVENEFVNNVFAIMYPVVE